MSRSHPLFWLTAAVLLLATGCQSKSARPAKTSTSAAPSAKSPDDPSDDPPTVGGEKVVRLARPQLGQMPQFRSVTILPGRGLNVFQITAWTPARGRVKVLASPSLKVAARILNGKGTDKHGNAGFTFGGAFLIPYANRIFGKVSPNGKTIITHWRGKKIVLPANSGSSALHNRAARHGLILESKIKNFKIRSLRDGQLLSGTFHAGDFGGHWLSKTDLHFAIALTPSAVILKVTATNVGKVPEPMAIGWHPYFAIPSGHRSQARLYLPATRRAVVKNHRIEKPAGKLQPIKGTKYDFDVLGGKPLHNIYLDDNFSHLIRSNGAVDVKLLDPLGSYGIEEIGISPAIRTIQVYSPSNTHFVAIEEQYNFVDPFGKEWHGRNTGMVDLKPGKSTTWYVRVQLLTSPR